MMLTQKKVEKRRAAFLLQEDILNSVYHCFGSHHKYKADYCKKLRSKQPSVSSPTKDAVGSPDAASSTDEHSSNGSPSSGTSGDLLSSSIQIHLAVVLLQIPLTLLSIDPIQISPALLSTVQSWM